MMSTTDSQATYCSEVEQLLKLTTKIDNKSCYQLPVRRSQRLSQKYANKNKCFPSNKIASTGKLYRMSHCKKKQPYTKRSLKKEDLQTTMTQEIFSSQDLREAQNSTLTYITCNQQQVAADIYENNEPLNLSKNVLYDQDFIKPKYSSLNTGLNYIQQKESITNLINSTKFSDKVESTPIIQSLPNIKNYSQDFQYKQPNTNPLNKNNLTLVEANENVNFKQIEKQNLLITKETRRKPRKLSTKQKKTGLKLIKNSSKNKATNMNLPVNELNYIQNTPKTTQESSNKSILPNIYPPHFKYQLPPDAVLTRPLFPRPTMITPDNTPSCELVDSTSTSPSLPESLRGVFDNDDIKDILNIEKEVYRLYDYHVQALAVILNVRVQYLTDVLDKIVQMNSNILKNVDKAIKMPFIEDRDLFASTPEGSSPSSGDVVLNSQSPSNQRFFKLTKEKFKEIMF